MKAHNISFRIWTAGCSAEAQEAPWLGGCSALVWAHGTNTDPLRNLAFAGVGFTATATWYQVSRTND